MATTNAVVFYDTSNEVSGAATDQSIDEAYVNGGSETSTTRVVETAQRNAAVNTPGPLALDANAQAYFFAAENTNTTLDASIYEGSTSNGALSTKPIYAALSTAQYNAGDSATINDIVDDPASRTLYFTQEVLDLNEDVVSSGIYAISETGGAAREVVSGLTNANYLALDLADNLVFFTDSTGYQLASDYGTNVNKLDVANLSTGQVTTLLTEPVTEDSQGFYNGPALNGIAVNPATHMVYYTTNNIFYNTPGDDGVYSLRYGVTGSGSTATASNLGTATLYSGSKAFNASNILLDPQTSAFYVAAGPQEYESDYADYGLYDMGVYEGSLSANNTTALTRVTPVSETAGTQPSNPSADDGTNQNDVLGGIAVDNAPSAAAGGTVTWIAGDGAVAADPGFTDAAGTSPDFTSATVTLGGGEPGDVLAATVTGTSLTASYNSATFTLTLSGLGTPAQYQQVIDSVTYNNTGSNPTASGASTSRTLTYAVSDGVVAGTAGSTILLRVAPTVAAGSLSTTFTGGGAAVAADPALAVTDYGSATLAVATVGVTTGFLPGDVLGFAAQNGISGSYNAGTGVLTLSGTASVAQYQAALRSVTFGFSPANANPTSGNDTSRTLSYVVSDGTLASTAVTSTLAVVHAAPTVSAGGTVSYVRGSGLAVATDPSGTVTAPDSGGTIGSATVTIASGFVAGDTLAFTPANGIDGIYNTATGVLGLFGTATAAQYQAAIDGVTFSTGDGAAAGSRTLSYVVNDGTASSAAATSTVTVTETPCFCAGTLILTPRGEIPVEQLGVGDLVTTLSGQARPLTWIGSGRSLVTPANPNARPIIVRAGALGDDVPVRDLHLTRGHSLLLDGVLIPVEYLVNDRSIAWDHTARVVEFFHLELEHHDILLADGAEAESYREDGNRHLFHNTDLPRHATHGMAPYAPVLTGGPEVDRVWARLLARTAPAETDLTGDADLHLLADGVRVEGTSEDPMRHRFHLDRVPFELRIGSRVCNPVRMGTGRDPRDLGVALRRLVLRGEGAELVLGWDSPWLQEGFNGPEPEAQSRWTTGSGLVPGRALAAFEGSVEVELELGMLTRYAMPISEAEVTAAMAAVHGHTGTGG